MPRLTCLMAVYNAEKMLAESIESVLAQTHIDFDFLIFNDGSTDSSLSILQKYQKKDSRIHLFSEDYPFGIPYALNQLMQKVKSKYFLFQGASDVSDPKRFEKLYQKIQKTSLIALGSSIYLETLEHQKVLKRVSEYAKEVLKLSFTRPKEPSFYYLSGIYSKKIIEKKIEFDETIPAYYDLLFVALIQQHFPLRLSNVSEALYLKRLYPGCLEDLLAQKKLRVDFEQIENFFTLKLKGPYIQYILDSQVFQAIVPF